MTDRSIRTAGLTAGLTAVLLLARPGALRAAELIVVDPSGGADFVELQDAIDAASEGANILIRGGTYSRPDGATWRHGIVIRRPVSLLADPLFEPPHLVAEEGPALEVDLVAGGEVRLSGIALLTGGWCTDAVVRVWSADRVVMDGCSLDAAAGIDDWCPLGPDALWARAGEIVLRETEAWAGAGGAVFDPSTGAVYGATGGSALVCARGRAVVIGAALHGGDGGDGYDGWAAPGFNGDGGDALRAPRVYVAGGVLDPGLSGQGPAAGGRDGREAPPWADLAARDLAVAGPAIAGQVVQIEARHRIPLDAVAFLAAFDLVGLPSLPPAPARPRLGAPLAGEVFVLGEATADADGVAALDLTLPADPSLLGVMLVLLAADSHGLTNPEIIVLLGPVST